MPSTRQLADIDMALVWWALGNKDKAFQYLFQALDKRMAMTASVFYSPLYEGIEQDPRSAEIRKRMNL